jgi:hypothetical protein
VNLTNREVTKTLNEIAELDVATRELNEVLDKQVVHLGGHYLAYWEGTYTIAELNMKVLEFLHGCNSLSHQLERKSALEELLHG